MFTVLLFGIVSQSVAIATGLELQVGPLLTAIMAAIGGILNVIIILGLSERIKKWKWMNKYYYYCEESKEKSGRLCRVWDRYGVAGLGLLAPSLVGVTAGTFIGIVLLSPTRSLLVWMSIGISIGTSVSVYGLYLGIAGIRALW